MTPPRWVQSLHLATWQYAVPVLFGPPPPLGPGQKVETGTCVVVEYEDYRYALSAAHVFLTALRAVQSDAKTDVVIGPLQITLTPDTIRYIDEERIDVATVPLTENEVARVEAVGYRVFRPVAWPPPTVAEDDGIIMAGYPGAWRRAVSASEHDFGATTLLLIVKLSTNMSSSPTVIRRTRSRYVLSWTTSSPRWLLAVAVVVPSSFYVKNPC
jgi:hypothetical protein